MEPSDNELISRAQSGEVVAFEQLVQRYDRRVLSIATQHTRNAEDAQDIYQEVFLRVYRGLPGFKFKSQFSTWLYRVVINVCLSYHRKAHKADHVSLEEMYEGQESAQAISQGSKPEQTYRDVEMSLDVENALANLPSKQRLVFILKHFEALKLREIADMMDCAEGTVKKYLFLATRKLRAQLGDAFNR